MRRYASAELAMTLCLSVIRRYCVETAERIKLVLAQMLFGLSYSFGYLQNKRHPCGILSDPNSDLGKCRHGTSTGVSLVRPTTSCHQFITLGV